jgi:alkaline phosphatase
MKKFSEKLLPVAVLSMVAFGSLTSGSMSTAEAKTSKKGPEVKNVIFLIGDGMGVSYTSAYRYLKDDPSTKVAERTAFDPYAVGTQMTYPEDTDQSVTDSASAATAMAAGIKTYNNAISVDNDGSEVKTILEAAKEKGKSTGIVATSEITHATPAAYGAHDEYRKNMDAIAEDYFDETIKGNHKIDVMLGGGMTNFVREDRNIANEFIKDGYSYVKNKKQLEKNNNEQVIGLFADGGLPKMIDRPDSTPSLEDMTKQAINRLKSDKDGFFLMVEGSQIDWAGHDNDIVAAMSEMEDFEKAFQAAIDYAKKDKHTLVVATADHSTGGFSVAANGDYNWNPEPIKAAERTPDFMAAEIANGKDVEATLKKYINQDKLALTPKEIQSVKDAVVNGQTAIDNAIEKIFDIRSNTGWTTGGHTGEDVPVYAYGPGRENFIGTIDNTDNAKILYDLLKYKIRIEDK